MSDCEKPMEITQSKPSYQGAIDDLIGALDEGIRHLQETAAALHRIRTMSVSSRLESRTIEHCNRSARELRRAMPMLVRAALDLEKTLRA